MTKAQIKQHKHGNAVRRAKIANLAHNTSKEDRAWYAKTIGIGQASNFSLVRNFNKVSLV